jgi:hypothetical protein
MKSKIATIFLITLSLFSCKDKIDEQVKQGDNKTTNENEDDFFRVGFNVIIQKDDNMHLYYTIDGSVNFNEENSIWLPVKGSDKPQEVVFVLPEGIIPSLVRIDFGYGKNEEQSDVDLKSFNLSYMGKKEVISGDEIFKYFTPFEGYTDIEPGTTILKRHKKDQASGPILYPQTALSEKINVLTSGGSPE